MYPWDPLEEAPSHISIPRVVISSIDSPLSEVERSIAPDCRPAAQDAYPGIYGSHGDHRYLDSYMTRHPTPSRVIYVGKTFLLYLLVERCGIMWLLQILEGGASMLSTLLKQYWWIILLIAVGLLVLQSTKGPRNKGTSSEKSENLPYVLKRYLMSRAERSFFGVLEQVTDSSKYYIFPQVSLNNLVTVEKGTGSYQTYHNKVDRKSVDFVLFDKSALSPVLAIELDDASHDREDRQERDAFVDGVLAKVGLPLLHVRAQAAYDPKQLAASIGEAIRR